MAISQQQAHGRHVTSAVHTRPVAVAHDASRAAARAHAGAGGAPARAADAGARGLLQPRPDQHRRQHAVGAQEAHPQQGQQIFWANAVSNTIVELLTVDLFLLVATAADNIVGILNMHDMMLGFMQSLLLRQDMTTSENMIEHEMDVFVATDIASIRASNERAALACLFFAPVPRCVLFFSCARSTHMCGQGGAQGFLHTRHERELPEYCRAFARTG